jgi:hypothetical protein
MSSADNLALKLFNYPGWRIEVNGRQVQAGTREGTGQLLVPAEGGPNRVQVTFIHTWDRTAGGWISVLAILLAVGIRFRPIRTVIPSKARDPGFSP